MTYLTVTTPQHKDSQLSYNNENSMFWLRGRGFQRYTRPDDTGVAFQCHDNPYVQVRNLCDKYTYMVLHLVDENCYVVWRGDFDLLTFEHIPPVLVRNKLLLRSSTISSELTRF